jgi:pimeloyl-ACP methyl ester carboxylesterase
MARDGGLRPYRTAQPLKQEGGLKFPEDIIDPVSDLEASADLVMTAGPGAQVAWHCFGEGRAVVLLHGDFGGWTHFAYNIAPLAKHFRVLVPDMPGYGRSDTPPEPHAPEHLATLLQAGVDELLGPEASLDIVGFSYGGIIAGHMAARLGRRVGCLVLSGPSGFGMRTTPPDGTELFAMRPGMSGPEVDAVHRHNLAKLMIADAHKVDDLAVRIQRRNIERARVRCGKYPDTTTLLDVLPQVTARLGAIWGGADIFNPPEQRARQEAALRRFDAGLDFRVVPGAGHWLFYEAPETANAWLIEMLEGAGQ